MGELDSLYNDLIMEHSMNSYNKKTLENADFCEKGGLFTESRRKSKKRLDKAAYLCYPIVSQD